MYVSGQQQYSCRITLGHDLHKFLIGKERKRGHSPTTKAIGKCLRGSHSCTRPARSLSCSAPKDRAAKQVVSLSTTYPALRGSIHCEKGLRRTQDGKLKFWRTTHFPPSRRLTPLFRLRADNGEHRSRRYALFHPTEDFTSNVLTPVQQHSVMYRHAGVKQ